MTDHTLLPPNSTRFEREVEHVTDRDYSRDIDYSSLWDADRIPAHMLPWLAWSLGVNQWSNDWNEHRKRVEIKNALKIRRIAGTKGAVLEVLANNGLDTSEVSEWFEYAGKPGHFRLVLNVDGIGLQPGQYEDVIKGATEAKRLSAHFDNTLIKANSTLPIVLAQGKHASSNVTLRPYLPQQLDTSCQLFSGAGQHASTQTTLYPN